jgi:GNAT superfamily N-acetyltransferase
MMTINIRPAVDEDRYNIASIRNSGREFMTHHTNHITSEQQDHWWFSANRQAANIWIAETEYMPVGFCMIRTMYDSGKNYGTLAILPEYRNMGIGTTLYRFMIDQCDELWIDIRNDNLSSMNAAVKAGFQVYNIGADITELVYR